MKSQKGFTLIELMVTVAVLAVVLSIAVPSFSSILSNNRIETGARELYGALQLARSEAVKRKERVRICKGNGQLDGCVNGTDWSSGWLMAAESGEVLKVWQVQSYEVTGPSDGVVFSANGMAGAEETLSITGPSCANDQKRTITVRKVGSAALKKGTCG